MGFGVWRRAALGAAVAATAALCAASSASAFGPCGVDDSTASACPLSLSPITVSGSLATGSENDWYVFDAYRTTVLSLTINNTDDPSCSITLTCADVEATLLHKNGAEVTNTQDSTPQDGSDQPQSISPTIRRGIYYVEVNGFGSESLPAPYTLSINANTTPAIHWPPLCQVPRLRPNTRLARAKLKLTRAFCLPGRVTHAYSNHTRRGRVIGLRPHVRAVRPFHTKVRIIVSRGRRKVSRRG